MRGSERDERRKEGVLVYWVGVKDGCSDAVSGVVVLENTTDGPPETGTRRITRLERQTVFRWIPLENNSEVFLTNRNLIYPSMNLHQASSVGLWLQRGLLQFLLSIIFSIATRWVHQAGLIGSDAKFQDVSGLMMYVSSTISEVLASIAHSISSFLTLSTSPARQSFCFPLSVVKLADLRQEKIKVKFPSTVLCSG